MVIDKVFQKYEEATLFYSGGKDSLTCLLLARPWWDRLNVVFIDTGKQFPEVYEHMEKVKALVPRFSVIRSDVSAYHLAHGLPVDVVPTRNTDVGDLLWGNEGVRVCSRFSCCKANIWDPMQKYFDLHRLACVIRGDRGEERRMGPVNDGGAEFAFPIFNWTTAQVHAYLHADQSGLVQERHFLEAGSSLDCMWCTAYFKEQRSRFGYVKKHYPEVAEQYVQFYKDYKRAVAEEMAELGGIE